MTMLQKLGQGVIDDEVAVEVLRRAGLPATAPSGPWDLGALVRPLDFVAKNKPFLEADPSLPSGAQQYLETSPTAALTAQWFLRGFYPCKDPRFPDMGTSSVTGGCYGCKTEEIADFGHVYSSKTSMVGFVEGIVSSLANWKLYALGIRHFDWTPEFLTGATPTAPVFKHALRPTEAATAGTVIHTQYCMAHLLEWAQHLVKAAPPELEGATYRLGVFRERVERGLVELAQVTSTATPAGVELFTALTSWSQQLLATPTA